MTLGTVLNLVCIGSTAYGKGALFCHSERNEESLLLQTQGKKRFLTPQTPLGMAVFEFFRNLSSLCYSHHNFLRASSVVGAPGSRCESFW